MVRVRIKIVILTGLRDGFPRDATILFELDNTILHDVIAPIPVGHFNEEHVAHFGDDRVVNRASQHSGSIHFRL